MGFHEVQFPTDISYGSKFGPGFKTEIVVLPSGAEERVGRWATARRRGDVSYGTKTPAQLSTLRDFYLARSGALYGFRYKDWGDFASTADGRTTSGGWGVSAVNHQDQVIGTGDGTTTTFQLIKTYTSGSFSVVRTITKPVSGTVVVALGAVNQTSGWSVDTTTGIVTFSSAPTLGTQVKAGFEFDVPCRFEKDVDDLFDITIDSYGTMSVPPVGIIELVNETAQPDVYFYGGAYNFGDVTDNVSISVNTGRAIQINPTVTGVKMFLPDAKTLQPGGPFFFVKNGGTQALSIRNSADTEILSLPSTTSCEIILGIDGTGAKVWWTK